MSAPTSVRKTYRTADIVTAAGALKLSGSCGEVPVKSITALRACRSMVIFTRITAPLSIS